jgi:hypothetical protein
VRHNKVNSQCPEETVSAKRRLLHHLLVFNSRYPFNRHNVSTTNPAAVVFLSTVDRWQDMRVHPMTSILVTLVTIIKFKHGVYFTGIPRYSALHLALFRYSALA